MRSDKYNPSMLFFILSLSIGIIWIFLMPAGAGYDEETHLARIYEMSRYHLIPNSWLGEENNGIPESMMEISYRQKQFLVPVTISDIQKGLSLGVEPIYGIAHKTRATYSPLLYLPQALVFYIFGYHLHTPILSLYWILRLMYLFSYTITVFFAIRLMPKFKWTLFVLALAPMAMIQAVTISADPLTNGMSFLFVAWSLYLVEGKKTIDKKNFWITMLLVFLLFNVKPNSTLLVLLLVLLNLPNSSPARDWFYFGFLSQHFSSSWSAAGR